MNDPVLRLTEEIPLDELGISCVYCGHIVQSGSLVVSFDDAMRAGFELVAHRNCAAMLTPSQLASATAIRVGAQMRRSYYFERDIKKAGG